MSPPWAYLEGRFNSTAATWQPPHRGHGMDGIAPASLEIILIVDRSLMKTDMAARFGPWNPGITSTLPRAYLPLSTIFRPENTAKSLRELKELSAFCGVAIERLTEFSAERLVLHEVLIRVMTDLMVPSGEVYADLGINFRRMTSAIISKYVAPHMPELSSAFAQMRAEAVQRIEAAHGGITSNQRLDASGPTTGPGRLGFSFWRRPAKSPASRMETPEKRSLDALASWADLAGSREDTFERSCFAALHQAAVWTINTHDSLAGRGSALTSLATTIVCNGHGSEMLGAMIDPYIREAAAREAYRFLPSQSDPIVMNTKGASASGKSTMRPLIRALAKKIGVEWQDFAVITPDIWRKYLLDYDSLGAARRYAGTLTAHEVEIIDKKLDRHMRRKAATDNLPHLLIDRFRFDSFSNETEVEDAPHLLTRHGSVIYMYFMITPPEATVERAWRRGEIFGRYKAVDDLLAHNVEAYSGIPSLFFRWALNKEKSVHYEFLDNSVLDGERPRTVAFGLNGSMCILDIDCLLDIDRYKNINVDATSPEDIYPVAPDNLQSAPIDFLTQCIRRISQIAFADHATGEIYASTENAKLAFWSRTLFEQSVRSDRAKNAFARVVGPPSTDISGTPQRLGRLDRQQFQTIGRWGDEM